MVFKIAIAGEGGNKVDFSSGARGDQDQNIERSSFEDRRKGIAAEMPRAAFPA